MLFLDLYDVPIKVYTCINTCVDAHECKLRVQQCLLRVWQASRHPRFTKRVQLPKYEGITSQILYLHWLWGAYTIIFGYLDPVVYVFSPERHE